MKLNKLTLHNINAIKGKWTIDFTADAFYQTGIFTILGATGAGKTTLLDAICLAIYGATPRLGKISKTDNALMSIGTGECFAAVELAINDNCYRFEFAQRRAKNEADGALQEPSHQILLLKNNDFELISEKKSHSEKLAPELLGMDFTQFTRSALLAQGGFSAFLQSRPEERGEILEKITGTDIYAKIGAKVYKTHSQKLETLTAQKSKLSDMVLLSDDDFFQLESELKIGNHKKSELDNKITTLNHKISQKNQYDKLNVDKEIFIQNLKNTQIELDNFSPNLVALNNAKQHNQLRPLFDKSSFIKNQLNSLNNEKETLKTNHSNFLSQKLAFEQQLNLKTTQLSQYQILDKLLSDNPITELSLTYQTQLKTLIDSIAQLKNQQSLIEQLRNKETAINNDIYQVSNQLTQDNQTYQTLVKNIYQELDSFIIQNNDNNLNELETLQNTINSIHNQERQLQQLQLSITSFMDNWQNLTKNNNKISKLNSNLTQLQDNIHNQKTLLAEYENKKHTAGLLLENSEQAYKLSSELVRLSDFIDTLTDGTPCPLCGSEHHPYSYTPPNRTAEHQKLWEQLQTCQNNFKTSQQEVENQKSELDSLINKSNQDNLLLTELQSDYNTKQSQLISNWQTLKNDLTLFFNQMPLFTFDELNDGYLTELKEHLNHQKNQLASLYSQNFNKLGELQSLSQTIHFHQQNLNKLQQTLSENQSILNQEKLIWKQKQSLPFENFLMLNNTKHKLAEFFKTFMPNIVTITQSQDNFKFDKHFTHYKKIENIYQTGINKDNLGQLYKIGDELADSFNLVIEQFNHLKEIIKTATYHYQSQKNEHTELINQLSTLNTQLTSINEQLNAIDNKTQLSEQEHYQAEQEFLTGLKVHFNSVDEFLSAQLNQEKFNELENNYNKLNNKKRQYELQLETTNNQLAQLLNDNPKIDTENNDSLSNELNLLTQEKEMLLTTLGATNNKFESAKHNKTLANTLISDIQKAEQELSNWTLLNGLIGSADGKKYRNFAQSLTLSALLDEANVVLAKMSDRYILTTASDPKNLLGIELIDTHQGDVVRQSKNLSGGESFLVSLSLALGLSAMSSQNRQIDSLFLDEGFGTLDEEALDIALTALSEIQASGKMIGIISHIGALKERIGTQILVQKRGEGVSVLSGIGVAKIE